MKIYFILFSIMTFLPSDINSIGAGCSGGFCYSVGEVERAWVRFKKQMKRTYTSESQERNRFYVFESNWAKIEVHNARYRGGEFSYDLKMNKFGDLTADEFRKMMFGTIPSVPTLHGSPFHSFSKLTTTPAHLDLRAKGMVTPVKDQGYCPLSGLFSVTGTLEGALYRLKNKLVPLSEQQILDCLPLKNCETITFSRAMAYLTKEGSIAEKDYPFEGMKNDCRAAGKRFEAKFPVVRHVARGDTVALEAVLERVGPVSIQMPASSHLQFYNSGVFRHRRSHRAKDFAALVVGYGNDPRYGDYWLVKNSWGNKWGEKGYIRVAKYPYDPLITGMAHFPDFQFIWQKD